MWSADYIWNAAVLTALTTLSFHKSSAKHPVYNKTASDEMLDMRAWEQDYINRIKKISTNFPVTLAACPSFSHATIYL